MNCTWSNGNSNNYITTYYKINRYYCTAFDTFLREHFLCDSTHPTFHVADLTLTVRPLLVRVHFIRRKKVRSVFGSLAFLEPEIT